MGEKQPSPAHKPHHCDGARAAPRAWWYTGATGSPPGRAPGLSAAEVGGATRNRSWGGGAVGWFQWLRPSLCSPLPSPTGLVCGGVPTEAAFFAELSWRQDSDSVVGGIPDQPTSKPTNFKRNPLWGTKGGNTTLRLRPNGGGGEGPPTQLQERWAGDDHRGHRGKAASGRRARDRKRTCIRAASLGGTFLSMPFLLADSPSKRTSPFCQILTKRNQIVTSTDFSHRWKSESDQNP